MSQHAARLLRNLKRHIENNGSTDAGTVAVLAQVIAILTPKPIRKVRTKERRGPMRSTPYKRWCKTQPCVVTGLRTGDWTRPEHWGDDGPIAMLPRSVIVDPAHTQRNGMSSKGPDSSCVPLERALHNEYDADRTAFEKKYGVNMKALAAEHYERFQKEKEQGK